MSYGLSTIENFLKYIPLSSDSEKRLKRCIAIIEALWIFGELSYSQIKHVLEEIYQDKISDKVLSQLLDFLKVKGLVTNVSVRIGDKYKNYYAVTGRGARMIVLLGLLEYLDEKFLKNIFLDEEVYEYMKSILYSYYTEKRSYVPRHIEKIIINNLEALGKIAEISTSCTELERDDVSKCIEAGIHDARSEDVSEVIKKLAGLISERTSLEKDLFGKCVKEIEGLIIHITGEYSDKVEIYSGYFYKWNPLHEIASIFINSNIRFEKCSRILYVKGSRLYTYYVLRLLIIMTKYRRSNQLLMEGIDRDYVISPFEEYDPGIEIQPDNTIIIVDDNCSDKIKLNLTEIGDLIGRNIVIIAKNPVLVKVKDVSSLAIVYHIQGNSIIKNPLKIIIEEDKHMRYIRDKTRLSRIDLFIVYTKPPKYLEDAIPRLKLNNLLLSPLAPPRIIVTEKNRSSMYTLEVDCDDKYYSLKELLNDITSHPDKAYEIVSNFLQKNLTGKPISFFPLCVIKYDESQNTEEFIQYKAVHNGEKIHPRGPVIEISRTREHDPNVIHVITGHIILHGG